MEKSNSGLFIAGQQAELTHVKIGKGGGIHNVLLV
jgi:hypothetical protein